MAISKERRQELVAEYEGLIEQSRALFLADYTGMSVKSMEGLRREVRGVNGVFRVTKNTLLKLALQRSNRPAPDNLLTGQLATGFALEEVPSLAKALVDFAKTEEHLSLRGAILGDSILSIQQVEAIANLPSLEQLRAQIIGLIGTPARNIASTVASGVRQVVNVVDAYAKSGDTSV